MPNKMHKIAIILIATISVLFVSGCSTNNTLIQQDSVAIQRIDSNTALVTHAFLRSDNSHLVLRGELKNKFHQRGAIPGYLKVELIDQKGKVFKETNVSYMQKNAKSRYAKFSYPIQEKLDSISTVRITHFDGLTK